MRASLAAIGIGGVLVTIAFGGFSCAKGSSLDSGFHQVGGSSGTSNTGSGGSSSTTTTTSRSTDHGATTGATTTVATGAGGFGGGFGGSAGVGGSFSTSTGTSTSSTTSSTGAGGCDHTGGATCSAAQTLTSISGDSGNDTRVENGTTSAWYKVQVTEDSNLPTSLSYTVSLDVPTGIDFELFVYEGDSSTVSCFATPSQGFGTPQTVTDSWGDNYGSDDARWLLVEVRYISGGMCGVDMQWTLTIEGDT